VQLLEPDSNQLVHILKISHIQNFRPQYLIWWWAVTKTVAAHHQIFVFESSYP